jgi:hypothetical protein
MQSTPFLTLLAEIEDPRRAEGKLYRLTHATGAPRLPPAARAGARESCADFRAGVWDFNPKPE